MAVFDFKGRILSSKHDNDIAKQNLSFNNKLSLDVKRVLQLELSKFIDRIQM